MSLIIRPIQESLQEFSQKSSHQRLKESQDMSLQNFSLQTQMSQQENLSWRALSQAFTKESFSHNNADNNTQQSLPPNISFSLRTEKTLLDSSSIPSQQQNLSHQNTVKTGFHAFTEVSNLHSTLVDQQANTPPVLEVKDLNFYYGNTHALHHVSLNFPLKSVTGMIGPSGCGKSTLLRVLNRMYDLYPEQRATGEVLFDGKNILAADIDLNELRSRIGMVFQKPTPFPMSIYENIAFGIRLHERISRSELDGRVEDALRRVALWSEVQNRLHSSAITMSGGQQQRLCIARTIAIRPEVILLDEPTSALDPISTARIEELLDELKTEFTIVIVTHNMQQAARCADQVAFFYMGRLIEVDSTLRMFTAPKEQQTQDYITGRFG